MAEKNYKIPKKIGKYVVGELIGQGTCGKVYHAFDPFVQREVAVKVAHVDHYKDSKNKIEFFSEAYAVGKLHHPNIVSLYDAGVEGDYNYLVMELVDGHTLYEYGSYGHKTLDDEKILDVMFKCCLALDYSHQHGVVHRDIKPTNIMISREDEVKLMDFSIAIMPEEYLVTEKGVAIGTPNYMSPEQVKNKNIGPASDLYSLATVMFELFTKKLLFHSSDVQKLFRKILHDKPPKLSDYRPDLPVQLSDIIDKALQKDPDRRFATGRQMAVALSKVFDILRLSEKNIAKSSSTNMLKNLNFFNSFNDKEINEILDASEMLSYSAGQTIIKESDEDDCFYIIARGVVSVIKGGVEIETLGAGDCFGELNFLLHLRRSASIKASTDVIALRVQSSLMDHVSVETQLRYYKAFSETIIYRLMVTSARLAAAKSHHG